MAANLKTVFRLFGIYGKLDLLWFLRDTKYCLLQIAADIVTAASAMAGVLLLAVRFGGLGGMSEAELLFMAGYGTMVDGLFMMFFAANNAGQISRVIGRGQLDHKMIQPAPLWAQLMTEGFSPVSGSSMLLCGIGLTVWAVHRMGRNLPFWWTAALLASLLCSMAVVLSVVYLASCMAFYAPAAAEEIAGVAHELFRSMKFYPLGGLSGVWQTVCCTVIPIGLTAWFPAAVLLGRVPDGVAAGLRFPALTAAAAAVFVLLTALTFRKGMKHYAKYSSPRYSGFGHR